MGSRIGGRSQVPVLPQTLSKLNKGADPEFLGKTTTVHFPQRQVNNQQSFSKYSSAPASKRPAASWPTAIYDEPLQLKLLRKENEQKGKGGFLNLPTPPTDEPGAIPTTFNETSKYIRQMKTVRDVVVARKQLTYEWKNNNNVSDHQFSLLRGQCNGRLVFFSRDPKQTELITEELIGLMISDPKERKRILKLISNNKTRILEDRFMRLKGGKK